MQSMMDREAKVMPSVMDREARVMPSVMDKDARVLLSVMDRVLSNSKFLSFAPNSEFLTNISITGKVKKRLHALL